MIAWVISLFKRRPVYVPDGTVLLARLQELR